MIDAQEDYKKYARAMKEGHINTLVEIEINYGLYGLPPDAVSVGLLAASKGEDIDTAIDNYLYGVENV
jgi:hypothetical protein